MHDRQEVESGSFQSKKRKQQLKQLSAANRYLKSLGDEYRGISGHVSEDPGGGGLRYLKIQEVEHLTGPQKANDCRTVARVIF